MTDTGQILLFDRALMRQRRARAAADFARHDALFREVGEQLIERLAGIKREFARILVLGAHGDLAQALAENGRFVVATDISDRMLRGTTLPAVAADEELLPFAPESFDLVIGNLGLHAVNDVPGALAQIKTALKPGGLFLAALPGGNTLHELGACLMEAELALTGGAGPRVMPRIEAPAASALLQRAGFSLPVTDQETLTLTYPDMFALMRDLRGMGEANLHRARLRTPTRRDLFTEAARLYKEKFEKDGRIPATFEIIFLHGWKND